MVDWVFDTRDIRVETESTFANTTNKRRVHKPWDRPHVDEVVDKWHKYRYSHSMIMVVVEWILLCRGVNES